MHARLARQILKSERDTPEFLVARIALYQGPKRFRAIVRSNRVSLLVQTRPCIVEAKVEHTLRETGNNLVGFRIMDVQDSGHILDDLLGFEHAVSDNLAHTVGTVLARHIIDDAATVTVRNIRIDIGHGHTFRVQESLEKEAELERVDVGNADDVGDERTRRRSTPRPHGNSVFARPVDKVPHDKQVTCNVHVADAVQLLVHALAHFGLVRRELKILIRETPFEAFVAEVDDVDIGIGARLAILGRRLRDGGPVLVGEAFGILLVFLAILLELLFVEGGIFRIVFGLHDGLDFLVFFRGQEFLRNFESGPKVVADTRHHLEVAPFRNGNRILDGTRDFVEECAHLGFGAEVELVARKTLVLKCLEFFGQGNAAERLVRLSILLLDVMDIAHGNDSAAKFLGQPHTKFVHAALQLDSVVTNRKIEVVAIKNLVEFEHEVAGRSLTTSSHILSVTAKEISGNSNEARLVFGYDTQGDGRNFRPTVRFLITETDNAKQVVIAFLVLHQERQAFVGGRILLRRSGRINIDMAPQHRLDGREPLFLTLLVQGLPAFLEF